MGLIDNAKLTALAEAMIPAMSNPSAAQTAARAAAVTATKDNVQKICQYIIDNMIIKGVTVALDAGPRTVETYTAGVGTNGGALTAAPYPVAGNIVDAKADTGTQNNDGGGHVE